MALVFVNVCWMVKYAGPSSNDPCLGGFGYLKDHEVGHESWNFMPRGGKLYGYAPRSTRIDVTKIGAASKVAPAQGVTVVWIARHPSTGKTLIVGWYKNATIHPQHFSLQRKQGFAVDYQIEAPERQAVLLTPDQRQFVIPTAKEKGNLGQSPVWYGGADKFRRSVMSYLDKGVGAPKSDKAPGRSPRNNDPEARKRIELAAVRHATRHYESIAGGSHTVVSVEKDCVGWDLVCTAPLGEELKVEVKGLTGAQLVVELTPNEYTAMKSAKYRDHYVVYVVTEAGTKNARAYRFRYLKVEGHWLSEEGKRLLIYDLVAARLTV